MANLLLGPVVRYVGDTTATVWVETDESCEVEVLDHRDETWEVEGHHYALVVVRGLEPGRTYEYDVKLDGAVRWPERNELFPRSSIRTLTGDDEDVKLVFGSCRTAAPHVPPFTLERDASDLASEVDTLYAYARRMMTEPREGWPDAVLMLGDQVYADHGGPGTREFIRARRDTSKPPWDEVADYEEYAFLYREAWSEPVIRWLFSNVPTAMIFDDHDVHDDWNTSASWVREMRAKPWWDDRIVAAFMSYWVYQHLGNLSPSEIAEDDVYARVRGAGGSDFLRRFAFESDRSVEGKRWSYHRDFGRSRLIVLDSRAGRVLDEGRRDMLDEEEWAWFEETASGDFDHLLIASSLPIFLPRGIHGLEAWNEAVCAGAWGRHAARLGERIRRFLDLEHWAAFERSFRRLVRVVEEVAAGKRGRAPATIVALSGDIHYAYLAEIAFPRPVESRVYQAVCSPFRNPLASKERLAHAFASSRFADPFGAALARAAGVPRPPVDWEIRDGPWFDNEIATLCLSRRSAELKIERTIPGNAVDPQFELDFEEALA